MRRACLGAPCIITARHPPTHSNTIYMTPERTRGRTYVSQSDKVAKQQGALPNILARNDLGRNLEMLVNYVDK